MTIGNGTNDGSESELFIECKLCFFLVKNLFSNTVNIPVLIQSPPVVVQTETRILLWYTNNICVRIENNGINFYGN